MNRAARRALAFTAALGLALVAAELCVARWFPLPASLYQTDPELLYVPRPLARSTKVAGPNGARHWVTTEFNAQGHRGPEFELAKTKPRAVVYGDSFVLAEDVEERESFVARLRADLAEGGACEVVNSGVSGYGPDQEVLKFEREAPALKPDLAVFVLYASNDWGDLVRDKIFRVDADGHAAKNAYVLGPSVLADFERKRRDASGLALVRAFRKYSLENEQRRIRERDPNPPYIDWYLRASQEEFEEYVGRADLAVRELWMDYYDADVALHPEWPSSQFKTKLMRAVVERMRDACARRGVAMLALIVPSAVDLSPKCTIRVDSARYPTWSPSRLTDALESITTELGVAHVNLYEPFRAAGPDGLYIGDGNLHWNEAGQALAARLAAAKLRELALWPPKRGR